MELLKLLLCLAAFGCGASEIDPLSATRIALSALSTATNATVTAEAGLATRSLQVGPVTSTLENPYGGRAVVTTAATNTKHLVVQFDHWYDNIQLFELDGTVNIDYEVLSDSARNFKIHYEGDLSISGSVHGRAFIVLDGTLNGSAWSSCGTVNENQVGNACGSTRS